MIFNNELYKQDISRTAEINLPWHKLKNKNILITGASGLICSFLIDILMYRNMKYNDNIKITAVGRNEANLKAKFRDYLHSENFQYVIQDISENLKINNTVDYIIHGASNANPIAFSKDPVGTMKANFFGMYNLIEYAKKHDTQRILYISSGEVYGEGDSSISSFSEDYCGYIDFTNPRACYPSSKRAAETLCASSIQQYGMDIVISRPCHIYGPTFNSTDSRVIFQFIRNALHGENIIMKSEGNQLRSYCYVSDAASALLYTLFYGENGQAYNVADKNSNVTIRKLAETISSISGGRLTFEIPDSVEKKGYSKVTRAVLNAEKLESLGWQPVMSLSQGLENTLKILKNK